jgi:hypothetical protein
MNVPFPFSSKEREGKAGARARRSIKERRQKAPAVVALVSEGLSSETDPAGKETHRRREPRRSFEIPGGACGLDGSAVFGSSPQPSGLPQPAGRFHRGATRGELMSVTSGIVEDANT